MVKSRLHHSRDMSGRFASRPLYCMTCTSNNNRLGGIACLVDGSNPELVGGGAGGWRL